MIHCENTACKNYFEDSCMYELEDGKNMVSISKNAQCETFEEGVYPSYLKVFKMNDYEWWCSHEGLEEFYPWYLKEHGLDSEDNPLDDITELNIDEEAMWWLFDDEENLVRLEKELDGYDERCKGGLGDIERREDGIAEMVTFRTAIKLSGKYTEPFCLASTNY